VLYDLAKSCQQVHAVSITHPQVQGSEESRQAREKLKAWFAKKEMTAITYTEVEIRQEIGSNLGAIPGDGMNQAGLWLGILLSYLDEDEDVYLGYIRADDFWHRHREFVSAFVGLQRFAGKTGSICFPLEWSSKEDVLNQLNGLGIARLCWYCELPENGKPCKKCPSCIKHNAALWTITEQQRPRPRRYKPKARPNPLSGKP